MKSKSTKKTKEMKDNAPLKGDAADRKIAELEKEVAELTAEKQDIFEKLQRVSADYINYQKRAPKQIADSVAYEKKAVLRSVLATLDNLKLAIGGAKDHGADESVIKGIELVRDNMLDALKAHGVERIVALGQEFDPSLHEAMMQRAEVDQPDNIVLEEFQNGYTLNGQVMRPCKVIVNKLPSQEAQNTEVDQTQTNESDEKEE